MSQAATLELPRLISPSASKKQFALTPKQQALRQLASTDATHILAYGGGRSGKTFGFVYCIAVRAISAPESRHLIGRLHNVDVRQAVMMDTFPAVMRSAFPQVEYELNKADQCARYENDAEIWFGGFDDKERVEKILGRQFATMYPNECSQLPYDTILMLRTRLAQNVEKINGSLLIPKMYYDLNPVGRSHWTYREFVQGVRPENPAMPILPVGSRAWIQMNPSDNPYLPAGYLVELDNLPERQRQRFKEGNYQSEVPGALWPSEVVDASRWPAIEGRAQLIRWAQERCSRIVVAVDPSGSDGVGGDSQGIIIAGKLSGMEGAVVLEDATVKLSPAGWGDRVVQLYHEWGADNVIAETNYGGAMIEHTISTIDETVPVKLVRASRGKHIRAEPVSALYEEREGKPSRVHHVGYFPELEDQMGSFTTSGYQGSGSPDRADALVWAISELMLEPVYPDYPWFVEGKSGSV